MNSGLIYEIEVSENADVKIVMTMTTPNCPMIESLPEEIEQKVKGLSEIERRESGSDIRTGLGQGHDERRSQTPTRFSIN